MEIQNIRKHFKFKIQISYFTKSKIFKAFPKLAPDIEI